VTPVRFSNLKQISKSPAHYQAGLTASFDSASMRLGRIVDVAILGGPPLVVYEGTRRGNVWNAFKASNAGAEIVTETEFESAQPIIKAVQGHEHAMFLLKSGTPKKRIFWDWLGRPCSGEPDVAGKYLVDLKTARCSEPGRFAKQAMWLSYHAQMAWYRNGMLLSGLEPPSQLFIVAVETAPPFPVTVLQLTERAIEQGGRLCRLWMEQLLACEASGHWPGYVESVVDLDVPDDNDLELSFGSEDAA
jgi:exodeoxyribonuclease VIII